MIITNYAMQSARESNQMNTQAIRVDGHNFSKFIVNRTPAGVWDDPKDMQVAVVFLSPKASDFING